MLSAAVAGDVFTSPSVDAVYAALRVACGVAGALLIVKNYTGDRLNFGLAAELARAEGRDVEIVVVADDLALPETGDYRRGIAGTVFVHKIAGAAAAAGTSLAEVARIARETAAALGTMGVALGTCTVPAAGAPSFTLDECEIELGLGIHGEPGVRRAPIASADDLAGSILETILADRKITEGARVALIVNDLGGSTDMEIAIVARAALRYLAGRSVRVERAWSGRFLTALEMPGVSLTVLPLDEERLRFLDADTTAPAWPAHAVAQKIEIERPRLAVPSAAAESDVVSAAGGVPNAALVAAFEAIGAALLANEGRLTELDRIAGDGDLGLSLARAAHAMKDVRESAAASDPVVALTALAAASRRAMGGTSGPLYAVFLLRAAQSLRGATKRDGSAWARAFEAGHSAIGDLGGAHVGDRTMLDALVPASKAFSASVADGSEIRDALRAAAKAARKGSDATASMPPRRGRSRYLGDRVLSSPDPGAVAAAIWLEALTRSF